MKVDRETVVIAVIVGSLLLLVHKMSWPKSSMTSKTMCSQLLKWKN